MQEVYYYMLNMIYENIINLGKIFNEFIDLIRIA